MFDDCLYVAVGGVFAFNDLYLSSATVYRVFNQFTLCVENESNRPNEVQLVLFGFMLWV